MVWLILTCFQINSDKTLANTNQLMSDSEQFCLLCNQFWSVSHYFTHILTSCWPIPSRFCPKIKYCVLAKNRCYHQICLGYLIIFGGSGYYLEVEVDHFVSFWFHLTPRMPQHRCHHRIYHAKYHIWPNLQVLIIICAEMGNFLSFWPLLTPRVPQKGLSDIFSTIGR